MAQKQENAATQYWWQKSSAALGAPGYGVEEETAVATGNLCLLTPPKPGDLCPYCQQGTLAYDGLFLLTCNTCKKVTEGGCFT